jgi:hypothetical protein
MHSNDLRASQSRASDLLATYCLLTGRLDELDDVLGGARFDMLGTSCRVFLGMCEADLSLFIECGVGEPPLGREVETYLRAMKRNFHEYAVQGALLGLDPDTDDLLCLARYPLAGMSVERLHRELIRLARMTRECMNDAADVADVERETARLKLG